MFERVRGVGGRRQAMKAVGVVVTVSMVAVGASCSGSDEDSDVLSTVAAAAAAEAASTTAGTVAPSTTATPPTTVAPPTTTVPPTTAPPTTVPATTTPPATTVVETTAPDTTVAVDTTDPPPTTSAGGVTYPTLPDGSPVPVLGIYNDEFVALTGVVPSEAAKAKLEALALANSKNPNATVTNDVTIDPTVPGNVGVRVIEMNSVRFPESSAEITPEHAAELDRAVAVLQAIPNVTVLVIGHSDQRGSDESNFRISDERAQAVANHLVAAGISPLRVSSRAVGEYDLLTIADDEAALALNRRTEFVFYGLLLE